LQELVACAQQARALREPSLLLETLCLRERLGSTAVGKGVAVPNARSIAVIEPRLVVARSRRGIDWKAPDEIPVQLVLLVLSPGEISLEAHHEFLARAANVARLQRHRQRLIEADDFDAVAGVLRDVTP
jgi:mannitol/fructose-specific phosphotransferase system IIA component (Ntr-type)